MSGSPQLSHDAMCRALQTVNYELHLIQYGLRNFVHARPWLGFVPGLVGQVALWSLYLVSYPVLLVVTIGTWLLKPIERAIRGA
ncbi:hypothetical protein G6O69_18425 [Pseudenhygromyxa sp. WMMC2535]|uniref:hypothetical protein n=1 Tax=Pseudenhygromyxa sp. WMMC2535 TaxID=2712867 RepID=UPI0015520AA2|nr:hypothetical protein [Pseudenhygromyxa sp. WMMC2535]NVB39825.1 hypothetical protein [Pseudenhygromyxa sp. WMMC2535]